jgi:hypothetical protein
MKVYIRDVCHSATQLLSCSCSKPALPVPQMNICLHFTKAWHPAQRLNSTGLQGGICLLLVYYVWLCVTLLEWKKHFKTKIREYTIICYTIKPSSDPLFLCCKHVPICIEFVQVCLPLKPVWAHFCPFSLFHHFCPLCSSVTTLENIGINWS